MSAAARFDDNPRTLTARMAARAAALLAREPAPVFALLDAARDRSISPMVRRSGLRYQSLYDGEAAEELAPFGPYLVALPPDAAAIERWTSAGWGKSFGVYLTCAEPFDAVRRQLRRFLKVELDTGRRAYFRFYDPRVLRVFLPNCTYEEWDQFFGPIEAYIVESEDGGGALRFRRDADEPEPERLALTP